MAAMKAWQFVGHRRLELVDVEVPQPAAGQVLLKVEQASICGSDTRLHWDPLLPESAYPLRPGMPCHEVAGTIVESRNDAFRPGTRAIVLPDPAAAGGGLAQYIASGRVIALPDDGPIDGWVMCQPMGTVMHAARPWGHTADRRIAVLGQGAIGLCFTMLAARGGARAVIGIDPLDWRLERAREAGATAVINPAREHAGQALAAATGGAGVDVVVDASGDPEGLNQSVELVNRGGLVIGFSLVAPDSVVPFKHQAWMRKQAQLVGTLSAGSAHPTEGIEQAVALRARGWVDPGTLITHRWSWERAPEAFQLYSDHADGVIKVVMAVS